MKKILAKYTENGHFIFQNGDLLKIVSKKIPDKPGIYIVYAIFNDDSETLVYIGKSGTMVQSGIFLKQLLRKRINNKHDGIKRQVYFTCKINDLKLKALKINWHVTFNNTTKDLPSYVEGLLLQEYFIRNNTLPGWNKSF